MNKIPEAVTELIKFLDSSPTDAEAWAELADLYVTQGMYQQAIFALEEVLLIAPNAWNVCTNLVPILKAFNLTIHYRCKLNWEKCSLWLPLLVIPHWQKGTLQNHSEDSAGVSSYAMIIFVAIMV